MESGKYSNGQDKLYVSRGAILGEVRPLFGRRTLRAVPHKMRQWHTFFVRFASILNHAEMSPCLPKCYKMFRNLGARVK